MFSGMKVVCIRNLFATRYGETLPQVGQIYTVRAIREFRRQRSLGILLNEIRNAVNEYEDGYHEVFFSARFFRPIVKRKTSIEIFKKMLIPTTEEKANV